MLGSLFGRKATPKVQPIVVSDVEAFTREVTESEQPVIVDVWSGGCGPCHRLAPILVDVATRYEGRVKVVAINAGESSPTLMSGLGVRATPTIIVYADGEELGREVGFLPASWFDQMIAAEFPE